MLPSIFQPRPQTFWDPLKYQHEHSSPQCLFRVKRDIENFCAKPPPGLFIAPDEDDATKVHALIMGPAGTPYEGGFFHFLIKYPSDYPLSPPRVRIMTTDSGRVGFNPNLYACGKVCLSILGTRPGPPLSPARGIEGVLSSIRSLLCENPYHDEPLFVAGERKPGDARRYNDFVQHETIRVAVCGMVEAALQDSPQFPEMFRELILKSFSESYDTYEDIAKRNLHLTGRAMLDLVVEKGRFQYQTLLRDLKKLNEKVKNKLESSSCQESLVKAS
ncbi:hypothetical protein V5799_007108 [Amblyomma americanum]|uniref:Ubiquitin-conjugating enzyme E2 Z n=1 Tax=Amblyomma americanum TaxID=6943 RepID=A0AAQ4DUG9_AMBAM